MEALRRELAAARADLRESRYLIDSIREGKADALVLEGPEGEQVFTLKSLGLMLDSIIDQSVSATVFLDRDGIVLRASPAMVEMFQGNPTALRFDEAFPLYLIDSRDGSEEPLRIRFSIKDVLKGASLNGVEAAYTRGDGTSFSLLLGAKPLTPSGGLFNGAVVTMMDMTPRKRAEVQLDVRNQQLRFHLELTKTITDSTSEALFMTSLDGRIDFMNPAAERKFGWSAEELIGKSLFEGMHPHHTQANAAREACGLCGRNDSSQSETREDSFARADGKVVSVRYSRSPVVSYGKITGTVFGVTDISEWKLSEAALRLSEEKVRQSQKMEAIGRLAGGIAHDFNNLLTAINGYAALGLERLEPSEPMRGYLEEIKRSGDRAAALTSQLLSYSRKQMLAFRIIDLNEIVKDTVSIVQRTLGEHIVFQVDLCPGPCLVNVDPIHIQQVFVNLAINSRDAMPNGGGLRIGTGTVYIADGARGGNPDGIARDAEEGLPAGDYIRFSISDDGHGMDDTVKAHLFEPFFTTKEVGKGTGLGLSMAYGIVKQHLGQIKVFSEAGRGCTIQILFPAAILPKPIETVKPARSRLSLGDEIVLLVEDDEVVLRFMQKVLAGKGYHVLEAVNGQDALALANGYQGPVDLLVTDVKMRFMGGYALAQALKVTRPGMPRIFISGYTEESELLGDGRDEKSSFLQKPFTPSVFAQLVRNVLDGVPVSASRTDA